MSFAIVGGSRAMARHEKPIKRKNPSGETVWTARWTDKTGKRRYGMKPDIPGTYKLKREAQDAIDKCHERDEQGPARLETVGGYAAQWERLHPRGKVTNRTNGYRLAAVLDVELEDVPLRDWPFDQLRRRHGNLLVDHLFTVQGRAHRGVVNILAVLSAMTEDAIDDEVAVANPWKGVKVRANDPRIRKARRPNRVFEWGEMHEFARACAGVDAGPADVRAWRPVYAEAMVRTLSDCGLRAGELFPLYVTDFDAKNGALRIGWTAGLGEVFQGTKTDHGKPEAGRTVPVPGVLCGMLERIVSARPTMLRPDLLALEDRSRALTPQALLFPSPKGRLWLYQTWWAQVWEPGREAAGMDIRPHEMRHSWVSRIRAAGIDVADAADAAGHTAETATKVYTHGLGRSFEAIKKAVGE